ncbi:hypothetical protein [Haloarcula salina]|uniref:Uncharacterized protein n=1 Tax=Haloarcula salina TaxID=1429914 RepID=A0AA41G3Q2_9EURY|nr:hypothetical protein [Haloarcula salina]MBV0903016.1 hypothetical protein [Haloarcula salina]
MRDASTTRRGFIAAAGATLFAGCSDLDALSGESRETIRSYRLSEMVDDEFDPIVVESVPVNIERARLAETRQRVSELLGMLPMPFGPDAIPNGHVRGRLVDAADDASESVEQARTAQTRFAALRSLRDARGRARYAAAGWAFADGTTTDADLRAEYLGALSDAEALRTDHRYLGRDPVDAALVHARIERNLDRVGGERDPSIYADPDSLLAVAEWGEHAETARALVSDSRYLFDRLASSLPDDAGTVETRLANAAESLEEALRGRRSLPPEPTDHSLELPFRLRYELRDDAESSVRRVAESPGPASAVLAATRGLTDFSAYDSVRERIEDGERFRVEDAAGVRAVRSEALDAIRTALDESPRPGLARPVLADAATSVAFTDDALARYRGAVRPERLDDEIRRYTTAAARARSVPAACRRVLDALGV